MTIPLGSKPPKGNLIVSVHLSIKHLAALHRMYATHGDLIETRGGTIAAIVTDFYELCKAKGQLQDFSSVESAIDYVGTIAPNVLENKKNRRSLIKALEADQSPDLTEAQIAEAIKRITEDI